MGEYETDSQKVNNYMAIPIIFIHYGPSKYLQYSFKAARHFNPDNKIILIGDDTNKHFAEPYDIEYYPISDFNHCNRIKELQSVFKVVGGKQFNSRGKWCNFSFLRWFITYNFCMDKQISRFWSFDSDVLILVKLSKVEARYEKYDYTKLCNGKCMQGQINNLKRVFEYTNHMISLFKNNKFLDGMISGDFKTHKHWGFTQMRALVDYEKNYCPKSFRLDTIVKDSFFDICMSQDHGYAREGNIKQIFWKDKTPYCIIRNNKKKMVRLLAANMSFREGHMPKILQKAGLS